MAQPVFGKSNEDLISQMLQEFAFPQLRCGALSANSQITCPSIVVNNAVTADEMSAVNVIASEKVKSNTLEVTAGATVGSLVSSGAITGTALTGTSLNVGSGTLLGGSATFNGSLTINPNSTFSCGTINSNGNVSCSGSMGANTMSANSLTTGNLTVTGNMNFGNIAATGWIRSNSDIVSDGQIMGNSMRTGELGCTGSINCSYDGEFGRYLRCNGFTAESTITNGLNFGNGLCDMLTANSLLQAPSYAILGGWNFNSSSLWTTNGIESYIFVPQVQCRMSDYTQYLSSAIIGCRSVADPHMLQATWNNQYNTGSWSNQSCGPDSYYWEYYKDNVHGDLRSVYRLQYMTWNWQSIFDQDGDYPNLRIKLLRHKNPAMYGKIPNKTPEQYTEEDKAQIKEDEKEAEFIEYKLYLQNKMRKKMLKEKFKEITPMLMSDTYIGGLHRKYSIFKDSPSEWIALEAAIKETDPMEKREFVVPKELKDKTLAKSEITDSRERKKEVKKKVYSGK